MIAYVDPGSGSLLLSLILGGVAGLTAIVKMRWHALRKVFRRSANVDGKALGPADGHR